MGVYVYVLCFLHAKPAVLSAGTHLGYIPLVYNVPLSTQGLFTCLEHQDILSHIPDLLLPFETKGNMKWFCTSFLSKIWTLSEPEKVVENAVEGCCRMGGRRRERKWSAM